MKELVVLTEGLKFPEGPVALKDGTVLVTEIGAGQITAISPDGVASVVVKTGGGPNGLAIGPAGAYFICNNGGSEYRDGHFAPIGPAKDYDGGSIQRFDPKTKRLETLYTHCGSQRLSSPNDLVFDIHGGFYFSDIGKKFRRTRDMGAVYYAAPDGSRISEVAFPVQANGVGLSPDGSVLYVAETDTARLWAFDIAAPGVVKRHGSPTPNGGRLVVGLPGFQRFDSLAVQADGNICVATMVTGCITIVSPAGNVIRQVKLPDPHPTNICFGGSDLRTAYITLAETGKLAAMPWPEPGLPLAY